MTFRHFLDYIVGFRERQENELSNARLIAFYSVVPHQGKGAKIKKPKDLFLLPSEQEEIKEKHEKGKEALLRYKEKYGTKDK